MSDRLLVLVRHGQSEWNLKNLFTGWKDPGLTEQGVAEARDAGRKLKAQGLAFDIGFTSVLTRAQHTLDLMLTELNQTGLPVKKHMALNERDYGDLSGLNKDDARKKWGEEQVHIWRRSYDVPPPPLAAGGAYDFAADRRYAGLAIPDTESLKTTLERVQPYWEQEIAPRLKAGDTVLIAAHGNSLRAIVKLLFAVADQDIVGVEIPTGNPLVIELDRRLIPTAARYLDEGRAAPLPALAQPASSGAA